MISLNEAVKATSARKDAVLQLPEGAAGVTFSSGEFQDHAMFSGFDIDTDELARIATEMGSFLTGLSRNVGLLPLFVSCWCDGLLTGLFAAKQLEKHGAKSGE